MLDLFVFDYSDTQIVASVPHCIFQPNSLWQYTGFSTDLVLKAAAYVASKVTETTKYGGSQRVVLGAVRKKYSYAIHHQVSRRFNEPDASDAIPFYESD